jgi:predicted DsbA family dithiol-disulfide isomerase
MVNINTAPGEKQPATESIAWHWYDFTCPFCYVSNSRNKILKENGFNVIALPFQAHPEVPAEGVLMGQRTGPMYEMLEKEAKESNLPLNWPARLPNSRYALTLAEQVRRHKPQLFSAVKDRLYAAHFARHEDLGSTEVVHGCLKEFGISEQEIQEWLKNDTAFNDLRNSEYSAQLAGLRGTPAWILNHQVIPGLQPRAFFQQVKANI